MRFSRPFALMATIFLMACTTSVQTERPLESVTLRPPASTPLKTSTPKPIRTDASAVPLGPTATPFMHIVQSGDTLLGIAIRYGVELEELLLANPTVDPGFLTLGTEILIPGPEGESAGSLLPTPTPVALVLRGPTCFENPLGGVWCLVVAENPTDAYIEGTIVQTSVYDQEGELIETKPAIGALDVIAPHQEIPFLSSFETDLRVISTSGAVVVSAVQIADITERYLPIEIQNRQVNIDPDGRFARVQAEYSIQDEWVAESDVEVRISIVGLDSANNPVGLVILKFEPEPDQRSDKFSTLVGSLGPGIRDVEILAEARTR